MNLVNRILNLLQKPQKQLGHKTTLSSDTVFSIKKNSYNKLNLLDLGQTKTTHHCATNNLSRRKIQNRTSPCNQSTLRKRNDIRKFYNAPPPVRYVEGFSHYESKKAIRNIRNDLGARQH